MEFQQFSCRWVQCLRQFVFERAVFSVELVARAHHQLRRQQCTIRRHLLFPYYFRKYCVSGERSLDDRSGHHSINTVGEDKLPFGFLSTSKTIFTPRLRVPVYDFPPMLAYGFVSLMLELVREGVRQIRWIMGLAACLSTNSRGVLKFQS